MSQDIVWVPVEELEVEPSRAALFETTEEEYAVVRDAIAAAGRILQPLLVGPRQPSGTYPVYAGFQRRRAAIELNHARVPCLIVDSPNEQVIAKYDNAFRRQLDLALARQHRLRAQAELSEAQQVAKRAIADELATLRDRFLAALAAHPKADRGHVLEALFRELVAQHPQVSKAILQQATRDAFVADSAPDRAAAEAEAGRLQTEIRELTQRLEVATASITARRGELEEANKRIAELEKKQQSPKTPDLKKIQKELDEKHAQAVEFSKKLKQANTDLDAARDALKEKTKRLEAVEHQVTTLRTNEAFWRQNWEQVCNLVLNTDLVAREIFQASELLRHVHEMLAVSREWPADLHAVVNKGIGMLEEVTAKIRQTAGEASVRQPEAISSKGKAKGSKAKESRTETEGMG